MPSRRRQVRVAALSLAVAATGFLGCGRERAARPPDQDQGAERSKDTALPTGARDVLVVAIDSRPTHLNPLLGDADRWCYRIAMHNLFEGLVRRAATGEVEAHLAAGFSWLGDGRTLDIELRGDVRFHDGQPMTATDVKQTLDQLLSASTPSELLRQRLRDIQRVEIIAADRLQIRLSRTNRSLLAALADVAVLPAHLYGPGGIGDKPLSRSPVGTGPYQVVSGGEGGDALVLQRYSGYWGTAAPIARVELRVMPDPSRALAALRNGEVDLLPSLHPRHLREQIDQARLKGRFSVYRLRPDLLRLLLPNTRRRVLRDRRVRWAIAHALDREAIAHQLRGELARLASAPLRPTEDWYDPEIEPRPHDLAAAEGLLDRAGWLRPKGKGTRRRLGHPLALRILVSRDSPSRRIAELVVKQLQGAGIRSGIDLADFGFVRAQLRKGRFDLAVVAMALDAENDLRLYFHGEGPFNYGGYQNPVVDLLLNRLRAAPGPSERSLLGQRLHGAFRDDPPVTAIFYPIEAMVASRRVQGITAGQRWPAFAALSLVP